MKKNLTTVLGGIILMLLSFTACQKEKLPDTVSPLKLEEMQTEMTAAIKAKAKKIIERSNINGKGALATWESTVGDVWTFVAVHSITYVINDKLGKQTTTRPELLVAILRSNLVTGDVLMEATGVLSDFSFNINNQLTSARLIATVRMDDLSGMDNQVFDLHVDMSWTGNGPLTKEGVTKYSIEEGGFLFKTTSSGKHRPAVAHGTVFALDENFTPVSSTSAQMDDSKSGYLTIQIK